MGNIQPLLLLALLLFPLRMETAMPSLRDATRTAGFANAQPSPAQIPVAPAKTPAKTPPPPANGDDTETPDETTQDEQAQSLISFDEARTDFQTAQVVASRAVDQFKVFELRYVRGNSDTESYLTRQNNLDNTKAQTYRAWAKIRRSLFEIKLLVLSVKDAEI